MNKWLVIDFDSTINKLEALDELAQIVDYRNGHNGVSTKIREITDLGMKGEITFPDSLESRLALLEFNKEELSLLIKILRENFSDSFLSNIEKFQRYKDRVIILSGGFRDFIIPALKDYGLNEVNIYANEFCFDKNGVCSGCVKENLLAQERGKVKQLKKLQLEGEVIMIGDGYTDYQVKEDGIAHKFIAFTENVRRDNVIEKADYLAQNFDEVFNYLGI